MTDTANISIRKYEEKYLNDLMNLWKDRFESNSLSTRKVLFKWLSEQNPFLMGDTTYYLAFEGEMLVGMCGYIPLMFSINGKKKRGYMGIDSLIAADSRRQGIASIMINSVVEQTASFAGYLWLNEYSERHLKKYGYLDIPNLYSYSKILNPRFLLNRKIKNNICAHFISLFANILLQLWNLPNHFKSFKDIIITEIDVFDDKYDRFFEKIQPYFGIITIRNQSYLNWKFVDKPYNNYKRFAASDNQGMILGYFVMKTEKTANEVRSIILDILIHPEKPKVFEALINKAIDESLKIGACSLEIICTYPLFIKLLRRFGFFRAREQKGFVVSKWQGQFQQCFIGDIRNWYLTLSDSDGDAWEVDS